MSQIAQIAQGATGTVMAAIGTSNGLSKLNEGRKRSLEELQRYRPTGFSGGGLTGSFANNQFTLTRDQALQDSLAAPDTSGISNAYSAAESDLRTQADLFGGLSGEVSDLAAQYLPGIGKITTERLKQVENQRRRSIGNLRENMQRRRVLGSSFAQDAISRADLTFAQEADKIKAESLLQELGVQADAIDKRASLAQLQTQIIDRAIELSTQKANILYGAATQQQNVMLKQFNFESSMAANMANTNSQIMSGMAQMAAQIQAEMFAQQAGLWANIQQAGINMMQDSFNNAASTPSMGS